MITPGPISSTFRNRTKQPVSSSPSILPSSPSPMYASLLFHFLHALKHAPDVIPILTLLSFLFPLIFPTPH